MATAGPKEVLVRSKRKETPRAHLSNNKQARDHSRHKAAKASVRGIVAAATTDVVVDVAVTGAAIVRREGALPQLLRRLEIEFALVHSHAAPYHGLHGRCGLPTRCSRA